MMRTFQKMSMLVCISLCGSPIAFAHSADLASIEGSTTSSKSSVHAKSAETASRQTVPLNEAQIRQYTAVRLGSQINLYVKRCMPVGEEVAQIKTLVTLELNANGTLASIKALTQTGLNDTNATFADPIKKCVEKSIRMASPFNGLDPEYYDIWKTYSLVFKAN